jgi:hypothetical protein
MEHLVQADYQEHLALLGLVDYQERLALQVLQGHLAQVEYQERLALLVLMELQAQVEYQEHLALLAQVVRVVVQDCQELMEHQVFLV